MISPMETLIAIVVSNALGLNFVRLTRRVGLLQLTYESATGDFGLLVFIIAFICYKILHKDSAITILTKLSIVLFSPSSSTFR